VSYSLPESKHPTEVDLRPPSPRHWSTEHVEPRQALAYWVDMVCARFIEIDIDTPQRDRFRAHMDQVPLGPVAMHFVEAEAQTLRRTHARIASSREAACVLLQLRSGHVRLRQMGREAFVGPGECVLMDSTEPYVIECPGPTSALALRLPRPWLQYWVPDPAACATRTFSGKGWSAALCAALLSLGVESASRLALPAIRVAEQIVGLLALAADVNAQAARGTSRVDDLMRSLRDQLHEPKLTPDALAQQFNISKRYVHHLFAQAHTTFGEQLMRLRLERAQVILRDARCANLRIGEVAAQCGFTDPSHFARRFRLQFGQTPQDFRRTL
jgi:AraC family transcriptional regulator, positive regulator of tynA and feaB